MDTDKKNPQGPENASIPKSDTTRTPVCAVELAAKREGPVFI